MYTYLVDENGSILFQTNDPNFLANNPTLVAERNATVVTDERYLDTATYVYRDGAFVEDADLVLQQQAAMVRAERDDILTNRVDPLVSNPLRWASMTTEQQNSWSQYRTDLLNVPQQSGFPNSVTWPTQPS